MFPILKTTILTLRKNWNLFALLQYRENIDKKL